MENSFYTCLHWQAWWEKSSTKKQWCPPTGVQLLRTPSPTALIFIPLECFLLVFKIRRYGTPLPDTCPGLGSPMSLTTQGGPPQPTYSYCLLIAIPWVWDLPGTSLCSYLSRSAWLLYILSYKNSVQLDFRWFSVMAVLQFSGNLDVFMGGEFRICPRCLLTLTF